MNVPEGRPRVQLRGFQQPIPKPTFGKTLRNLQGSKKLMQAIDHHEKTAGNIDHVAVGKFADVQVKLKSTKNRGLSLIAAAEQYWNDGKQPPLMIMEKIDS